MALKEIARCPLRHIDDRDSAIVCYDGDYGALNHYVVWVEGPDGSRYHGNYFNYETGNGSKEEARKNALAIFIKRAAMNHNMDTKLFLHTRNSKVEEIDAS